MQRNGTSYKGANNQLFKQGTTTWEVHICLDEYRENIQELKRELLDVITRVSARIIISSTSDKSLSFDTHWKQFKDYASVTPWIASNLKNQMNVIGTLPDVRYSLWLERESSRPGVNTHPEYIEKILSFKKEDLKPDDLKEAVAIQLNNLPQQRKHYNEDLTTQEDINCCIAL